MNIHITALPPSWAVPTYLVILSLLLVIWCTAPCLWLVTYLYTQRRDHRELAWLEGLDNGDLIIP